MLKIYLFGAGIILLCLAGWFTYRITKPHHNVAGQATAASISAPKLYNDFLIKEPEANKKWVGRVIEIRGVISSVEESSNYVAINIRATETGGVNCSFLKTDLDRSGHPGNGDSVTIIGKCTGFLADVNMVDCIIKK